MQQQCVHAEYICVYRRALHRRFVRTSAWTKPLPSPTRYQVLTARYSLPSSQIVQEARALASVGGVVPTPAPGHESSRWHGHVFFFSNCFRGRTLRRFQRYKTLRIEGTVCITTVRAVGQIFRLGHPSERVDTAQYQVCAFFKTI